MASRVVSIIFAFYLSRPGEQKLASWFTINHGDGLIALLSQFQELLQCRNSQAKYVCDDSREKASAGPTTNHGSLFEFPKSVLFSLIHNNVKARLFRLNLMANLTFCRVRYARGDIFIWQRFNWSIHRFSLHINPIYATISRNTFNIFMFWFFTLVIEVKRCEIPRKSSIIRIVPIAEQWNCSNCPSVIDSKSNQFGEFIILPIFEIQRNFHRSYGKKFHWYAKIFGCSQIWRAQSI
jgi:hypothetical protein